MKIWKFIFFLLFLVIALVVLAVSQLPDSNFHIVACNVGEGDASLLIFKNIQILVDGGPDKRVLSCLGKYLPFWDRELELVILTHPDADHFMGLIDVFKGYRIDNFLYNPVIVSKLEYKVLEKLVGSGGVKLLHPVPGQELRLDLIHLDILAPPEQSTIDNLQFTKGKEVLDSKTNEFSIVNLVSFGNFKALLTGDMTPEMSDALAGNWSLGRVNYIKIPHHGSKNGLTENLLNSLDPRIAVISVGKNFYGHPAPEILKMLSERNIKVLRTDEKGDIEVVSDGSRFWLRD